MVKSTLVTICFLASFFKGASQNFGALPYLNNDPNFYYLDRVITDSVHDKLLVSGRYLTAAGTKTVRGICSWNGMEWDSLQNGINTHDNINAQPNGVVLGAIRYNGKLLVGGIFESIGGKNATALATWDGTTWDSLPTRAFKFLDYGAGVYDFAWYDNKLYLCGSFDTIQGQKANGLATYNGSVFQPVIIPSINAAPTIICMAVYQNELYVGGNFYTTGNPSYKDIYKFNGTNWSDVGGSIEGATSSVASMVVYNNELYVAGYFVKADGNSSNIIMKWNGTSWHDVSWGSDFQNGAIWKLLVYHNKLYAFGSFDLANDVKASKIAVYDGSKWCTYIDTLQNTIFSAAIYHDSIYVAGSFKMINSDPSMKFIAKLQDPENVNECGIVGIKENYREPGVLSCYPNPFAGKIQVSINQSFSETKVLVFNSLGQVLKSCKLTHASSEMDLSDLPDGTYFLKIQQREYQYPVKLIKLTPP